MTGTGLGLQALVKREDVADVSTASGSRFTVTLASTVAALYRGFQVKANPCRRQPEQGRPAALPAAIAHAQVATPRGV